MTHGPHCNPLCFCPGSDGSNTALSSQGKKDSFVLSNKVIQNDGHSCVALCHNGPDEPHSPTPPSQLTIVPLHFPHCAARNPFCPCHQVSPPPPQEGGRCRSPPSFPFWFCPPRGPLMVDTVLRVMAQMHSRPSICPTRAQTARERGGGLDSARFRSCPPVISCLCEVRGGGSQVIVYTGIKERTLIHRCYVSDTSAL